MEQKVFINYRLDGVLANAFQVTLDSEDISSPFGIKRYDGVSVIDPGSTPDNPSTGLYQQVFTAQPNVIYVASWKVIANNGDEPTYVVQTVGPFADPSDNIRAVADSRGTFIQGSKSVVFLMLTDLDGNAQDADPISYTITDVNNNVVQTGTPEKAATGYYALDWNISPSQDAGTYTVLWSYSVQGNTGTELQSVVIAGVDSPQSSWPDLYSGRIQDFRGQLTFMIRSAQSIPVYNEPAKPTTDFLTYNWTFPRWNQSAGVRVYRNRVPVTTGFTVNYFDGNIKFDQPLTQFDRVTATYNFRWFKDEELDRFLSNSLHIVNFYPAITNYSLMNLPDQYIGIVLWGAAVDAFRHMMTDILFQEPALVFGDEAAIERAFQRMETTKKNYEDMFTKALDTKKYSRNYVGLTRGIVVPEYTLPGGRSRWFRYLFSSNN